ncbi:MAG TPA: GNAT family N-acetyltransferase [Micromonosporaceae bacterium]
MAIPVLRGERVVLRAFRAEDAADVLAGCCDPLTQRFLPLLPSPYTLDDARSWISEGAPAAVTAGGWSYGIADPGTDRIIGAVGVTPREQGTGEIGYWVGPSARRRGAATEATRLLTDHALAQGLQRIVLRNEPENLGSQRVAIAAGFTREGLARGARQSRDGSRHDLIIWARLAGDSGEPTARLLPDLPGFGVNGGELSDGVAVLRPTTESDTDDTYALRILPECVARSVPAVPPDQEQIRRRCAQAGSNWLAGVRADLTIRDAVSGAYAGEISLQQVEAVTGQAMIGYSLTRAARGHGFATRAVRLLVDWTFDQSGIARIIAGTAPDNLASQRVLARAGFIREAYLQARLPGPDGQRIDDVQWVRLREPSVTRPG